MQKRQLILPVSRHFAVRMHYKGGTPGLRSEKRPSNQSPRVVSFVSYSDSQSSGDNLSGTWVSQWEMDIYKTFEEAIESPPPPLQKPAIYFFLLSLLIFLMPTSTRIPMNAAKLQSLANSKAASLSILCQSLRYEQKWRTRKGSLTINYNKSTVHSALTDMSVLTGCNTTVKSYQEINFQNWSLVTLHVLNNALWKPKSFMDFFLFFIFIIFIKLSADGIGKNSRKIRGKKWISKRETCIQHHFCECITAFPGWGSCLISDKSGYLCPRSPRDSNVTCAWYTGHRLISCFETEDTHSCSRKSKPWKNSLVGDMLFKTLRKGALGKICFKCVKVSAATFLIRAPVNSEETNWSSVRTC